MIALEDCCYAHSKDEHRKSIASISRFSKVQTNPSVNFDAVATRMNDAAGFKRRDWVTKGNAIPDRTT
jgi:hypothetical protein